MAVVVDRRFFVVRGFVYAAADLVDVDVDRVVQMTFAKFVFGTDIDPNGRMLRGLGCGYAFLRVRLRRQRLAVVVECGGNLVFDIHWV